MKTKFILGASLLLGAVMLASCVKTDLKTNEGVSISLTGGISGGTKTNIDDPANPKWTEGDAIGIHVVADDAIKAKNVQLDGVLSNGGALATFTGEIAALENGSYTIYGYYPYGTVGNETVHHGEAKILIPATQHPTATSFDPQADLMVVKPVAFTHDGSPIEHNGLQFKRVLAIVKIVFANIPALNGEPLKKVTFTSNDPALLMTGKSHINLADGSFAGFYADGSTMVTAEPAANILANNADGILVCIPVMKFNAGTKLTFTGETQHYTFTREVTVPTSGSGIQLTAGNIYTLKIPAPATVDTKVVGATLPFSETFNNITENKSGGKGDSEQASGSSSQWTTYNEDTNGNIVDVYKANSTERFLYKAGESTRIGAGSGVVSGVITKNLDLSGEGFTVKVVAKGWINSPLKAMALRVQIGDEIQSVTIPGYTAWTTQNALPNSGFVAYFFNFSAKGMNEAVKIYSVGVDAGGNTNSESRIFIDDIKIYRGHLLAVSPATQAVPVGGGSFSATVESDVAGFQAATLEDWIHITSGFGVSPVTYTVDANNGAERQGTITVSVSGAEPVSVTVNQAAASLTASTTTFTHMYALGGETNGANKANNITSNVPYTISSDKTWLTVTPSSGATANNLLTKYIAEQNTGAQRTAHITISIVGNSTPVYEFDLVQDAPAFAAVANPAPATSIAVTSNTSWTISADSWIHPNMTSNTLDKTVTYTLDATTTARDGAITFSAPGCSNVVIPIHQDAAAPYLYVTSPSSHLFELGAAASAPQTIAISSNIGWAAFESYTDGSDGWITLISDEGTGNGTVTFTVSANSDSDPRTGAITILGDNNDEVVVTITQAGASATPQLTEYYRLNTFTNAEIANGETNNYNTYLNKANTNAFTGKALSSATFDLTFGAFTNTSNARKITIGTNNNATNYGNMNLGSYASTIGPLIPGTYTKAACLVNVTQFNNIGKITVNAILNDDGCYVVLAYKPNGGNWTLHTKTPFTQAKSSSAVDLPAWEFASPVSGQFAIIIYKNSPSTEAMRLQSLLITYYDVN